MTVKRFIGSTSREVLTQVRAELGADALILSSRSALDGIEILAISHSDMGGLLADGKTVTRSAPAATAAPVAADAPALSLRSFIERSSAPPRSRAAADGDGAVPAPKASVSSPRQVTTGAAAGESDSAATASATTQAAVRDHSDVLGEIRAMKDLLAEQMAAMAWGESVRRRPLRGLILQEMIDAGFSTVLARAVTEKLPDDFSESQARQWLLGVLARNLCCRAAPGIVEKGGVFALVGPTGVGKTTTAAKIAAQCVVQFGARGLGLITTDSYRVGAHDQLRIYGKILGVPVLAAQDADELRHALSALAGKHLVLIDTMGMGQRDSRVAEQRALLSLPNIRKLLLLNASSQPENLGDVVRAYGVGGLDGAVITKLDEAVLLGGVLDLAIRRRLPLQYITNGQRVPEDIHPANAVALIHRALKAVKGRQAAAKAPELVLAPLPAKASAHV